MNMEDGENIYFGLNNTDFEWTTDMLKDLMCAIGSKYLTHMILLAIFSIIGVIGNVSLLAVVWSDANLRNSPNILLTNVAFADLLYILVTAPIRIEHELHPCWLLGTFWCSLKHFTPIVCQSACVFSLVALSRERYTAIVHGLQSRFSQRLKMTIGCVVLLWLVSFLSGIPIFWLSYVNQMYTCISIKKGSLAAKIYETFRMFFLFAVPLFAIAFHYSKMAKTLLQSTKSFKETNNTFVKQSKARARLAYLALTISIFFGVFWFPSVVYQMWFHFTKNDHHFQEARSYIDSFRHVHYYMSLANSCLNPWVVFIMSSSHRRKLFKPFRCGRKSAPSSQDGTSSGFQSSNRMSSKRLTNTTQI